MAKKTRTRELWHIPKRGSVHQTIHMVYILASSEFDGKKWTSSKQEKVASEMSKAGLTQSGKALTHQSVRTLLANLPKYLCFVNIDETSKKLHISRAGYALIKDYKPNLEHTTNLKDLKDGEILTSDDFKNQMLKLIITNPSISSDCEKILVFPFRLTLELLLEVEYLDMEEIAYFLFHTKTNDELPKLVERIKNFRKLSDKNRISIIEKYKKTEEGNLTLVKAPSAGYFMTLCYSTGLCEKKDIRINKTDNRKLSSLILKDKAETKKLLNKFKNVEIFDFENEWFLWYEYFGNPTLFNPPFSQMLRTNLPNEVYIDVRTTSGSPVFLGPISQASPVTIPVFHEHEYEIQVLNLETTIPILKTQKKFSKNEGSYELNIKSKINTVDISKDRIIEQIHELLSNKYGGFDSDYEIKLKSIEKITGKKKTDRKLRGARLECLFDNFFCKLKEEEIVDDYKWNGKIDKFGICQQAPGGKIDNTFSLDEMEIVLELTTIGPFRSQWSGSEGSSVPDHIVEFQQKNPNRKTIGIFSAPGIHSQQRKNLLLNAEHENVTMLCLTIDELLELLSQSRQEIKKKLQDLSKAQLSNTKFFKTYYEKNNRL